MFLEITLCEAKELGFGNSLVAQQEKGSGGVGLVIGSRTSTCPGCSPNKQTNTKLLLFFFFWSFLFLFVYFFRATPRTHEVPRLGVE